jgi:Tol biopolymer transport system component
VPGDTSTCSGGQSERSCSDIFLKDLDTGAVVLISSSASGESGNGDSFGPSLSADGRYVAFHSRADNLVPDDTNNAPDVFVKDTEDGSIERVSEIAKDIGGNSDSYNAVISDKGDKVAFISAADNLKAGDANGKEDIFVSDLQTGVIKLVSLSASGIVANGNSTRPAMAPDGDSVAFDTLATSLVADDSAKCGESDEAASCSDILLKNLLVDTIMLISSDNDGAQGNWNSYSPSLSADGQMVAFVSEASNLVRGDGDACSDENSTWNCSDIYLKDLDSGKIDKISIPANE